MLVMAEDMTQDDLREFGWDDDSIYGGLIADACYFVFFKDDELPYDFMRHFRGSYEKKHYITFRGVEYGSALCAWCN
jgi:hypothetical protein